MKIRFSPIRMDARVIASVLGDVVTINGVSLDFSPLQEGSKLPYGAVDNEWVVGDVTRENGVICLCLLSPHGPMASRDALFPSNFNNPLVVDDGDVPFPLYEVSHD